MFKRAFNGDTSPDVIEWQQNNRSKMQYVAAIFDGARQGAEIGAPIREVGLTILGGEIGAVGVNAVAKTSGKLLFSYKLYRQAEQKANSIMKNGPTDRM